MSIATFVGYYELLYVGGKIKCPLWELNELSNITRINHIHSYDCSCLAYKQSSSASYEIGEILFPSGATLKSGNLLSVGLYDSNNTMVGLINGAITSNNTVICPGICVYNGHYYTISNNYIYGNNSSVTLVVNPKPDIGFPGVFTSVDTSITDNDAFYNLNLAVTTGFKLDDYITIRPLSSDPYLEDPDGPTDKDGGAGDFDGTGDTIGVPQLPTTSAVATNFVSIFAPTVSQVQNLASYMWSSGFDLTTFKKLFADPMDCILGLK